MSEMWGIKKLNSDNYETWRSKLELLLIKGKVWYVVKEDKPEPVTDKWIEHDNDARATIGLLVEDNQLEHIVGSKSAKEAWDALENHHRKSSVPAIIILFRKLFRSSLPEGGDAEKHVNELLGIANKLSRCGEGFKDKTVASILLGSLPDSYDPLIMGIGGRSEELTSKFVKDKIIDEFRRRKCNAGHNAEATETAMKIQRTKDKKDERSCFFCKGTGHLKKDCYKYKAWKKKQGNASANKATECYMVKAHTGLSQEIINTCFKVKGSKTSNTWYLDSGATSHMACEKDLFVSLKLEKKGFVNLADEAINVEIEGIGKCIINCQVNTEIQRIVIDNVLYVPRLSSNLVSVKKLARDGYKIILEGEQCNIFKGIELKAVVRPYGDLYELNTVEQALVIKDLNCSKDCIHQWHRRLGHRSLDAIKSLTDNGLAKGIVISDCKEDSKICESCIQGKMTRKCFPKESKGKTEEPLDLVHTDVCGPMQTMTPGNKKYILSVIDDFSRYTKIYLMETKDQTAACIKNYVEFTKT